MFVSWVREDQPTVRRLIEALKDAGTDVWWDKDGLRAQGGAEWKEVIEEAIQRGDRFVACFSDRYWTKATAAYMNVEIAAAIERLKYMPPGTRWFVPVRLADCEVPGFAISQPTEPRRRLTDLW